MLRAENLRHYNSLALSARAAALVEAGSDEEVLRACRWARQHGMAVIPLGEGSNVVFAGELQAMVLRQRTRGIRLLQDDGNSAVLRVGAGENWHSFVLWTLQHGLFGLENLALIPGTVGAAPIQNIGAYGVELASSVAAVHALRIDDGKAITLCPLECAFGYRDSIFKRQLRDAVVITAVDLRLARRPALNIDYPALAAALAGRECSALTPQAVFQAVVDIRRARLPDPAEEPNAGSFFKNPVIDSERAAELARRFPGIPLYRQGEGRQKTSAAWLIDYCGWKGRRRGGVGVHPGHALVLVNYGSDSGLELLSLAQDIAASVEKTFAVALEIEPRVYGQAA
jgi:UDP-N-acetylmuramate dehydrogenase